MGSSARHIIDKGLDVLTPFDFVVLFTVWFAVMQRFRARDILFIALVVAVMMEMPFELSYAKRIKPVDNFVHAFNVFYYSQVVPHLEAGWNFIN